MTNIFKKHIQALDLFLLERSAKVETASKKIDDFSIARMFQYGSSAASIAKFIGLDNAVVHSSLRRTLSGNCTSAFEEIPGLKRCCRCGEFLPESSFHKTLRTNSGLREACKDCRKLEVEVNYDHFRTYFKEHHLKSTYGITIEEYEDLCLKQEYKCAICFIDPREQFAGHKKRLHIDHDHKTNKIRGGLCYLCNQGLGSFRDRPEVLKSAALYLEKHLTESGTSNE